MARKRSSITLTIIRCGETTWDAQGCVHGATDLPLSDAGRHALVEYVRCSQACRAAIIHHPPDEAARDSARIVGSSGVKLRDVEELTDPNLGLLEGLTEQAFAERFRSRHKQWKEDPISLVPPEGEALMSAAGRIFEAVSRIIRRSRGDEVAIVLHDLGDAMLRCWMADRPLSEMREMESGPLMEKYVVPLSVVEELEHGAVVAAPAA